MTKRASFTKLQIRRFMTVAKQEGCAVEFRPDGKVVVHPDAERLSLAPEPEQTAQEDTWADR